MSIERIGAGLLVAGGVVIPIGLALGWSGIVIAAIALVGLGLARMALLGSSPLGGRLTGAALGTSALGLVSFTLSALLIEWHPAISMVGLGVLVLTVIGIAAMCVGCLLLGLSALRTILAARRVRRGFVALLATLMLLGLTGFSTFVGAVGSGTLLRPDPIPDCRTPLARYGWTYEAINYDIADDTALQNQNGDMEHCTDQGASAGSDVVTSDGIRIAGWYVPAADRVGPSAATVVLVHGWDANKSEVLRYAVPLHQQFNVVAFDLRDGGRSSRTESTFGLREKLDLEAVIDWLVRTKNPVHIAVMGNSMGGGTATLAAASDPRIEALILDSTHAHVSDILDRRLEVDAGYPSEPGMPAILAGIWLRTGLDLMDADPVNAIPALGRRPLLIVHGAADIHDLPARSADVNYRAAVDAGVPVEMHMCPGATHGHVIDTCPTEWGQWVVAFLDRVFHLPA